MNNHTSNIRVDEFANLNINYGKDSITDKYFELSKNIDLDNYVKYKDVKFQESAFPNDIIHVVISVKVSDDSPFIPFLSVLGPHDKQGGLVDLARGLQNQGKGRISYNYSDFLKDIESEKNRGLMRLSFETSFNGVKEDEFRISKGRVIGGKISSSQLWLDKQKGDEHSDAINQLMQKYLDKEKCFAKEIAREYFLKFKIQNLSFSIFSFDASYDGTGFLTRLMLIGTSQEELDYYIKRRLDKVREFVSSLRTRYTYDLIQKNRWEATKSAVSAIMSRNMSHNLGSHYLYYTKTYLDDLAKNSGSLGPDIRGAAKVLGYMQARMDYLATVISNDRYPNGTVNFKSQLYDELTVDDFSKRHFSDYKDRNRRTTNFLLSNLVMSENFTRPSIMTKSANLDNSKIGENFRPIQLCVKLWDGQKYVLFTGKSDSKSQTREKNIKNELSKLNIALPGGVMSAHAFFNVVENFIRNSAKYLREDFDPKGLIFTISIRKSRENKHLFDIVIYDNKKNAQKVLPVVNHQLQELTILENDGRIEKSSKGIKEMLFSSIWMKTYKYPTRTFVDVIHEIQIEKDAHRKIELIKDYGFSFVAVTHSGKIVSARSKDANLGIKLSLPEFCVVEDFEVKNGDTKEEIIAHALSTSSDVVCVTPQVEEIIGNKKVLETYFTRPYYERNFDENAFRSFYESSKVMLEDEKTARMVYRFKSILDERFSEEVEGDIDNMCLVLGSRQDQKQLPSLNNKIIYFERHLNTQKGFEHFLDYAYVDSISGGNFTITLNSLIDEGIDAKKCRYKTWYDKLLGLKIKESALTRITLIDERLSNSMEDDGEKRKLELSLKNIRVLNVNIEKKNTSGALEDLFEGNKFQNGSSHTHFLSIHLGLIEKIIKSEWGRETYGKDSSVEVKVNMFMKDLERIFGDGKKVFISVHSGRGNFSKELEGPLATYPFLSLSAIENAFNNSKYLLAQLFYNTIYIGKGIINQ